MENVYLCFSNVPVFLEFSWQNIEKYSVTKFHENPSSGIRVVPMRTDRQTDVQTNRQTDMTNRIVTIRNFAKV